MSIDGANNMDYSKTVLKNALISMVIGLIVAVTIFDGMPWLNKLGSGYLIGCCIFLILMKLNQSKPRFSGKSKYMSHDGYVKYVDGKQEKKFYWKDVSKIEIVTTDKGPWEDDLWWVIFLALDDYVAISGYAENVKDIMDDIVNNLGEPDWHSVIEASGSCENAIFPVWEK